MFFHAGLDLLPEIHVIYANAYREQHDRQGIPSNAGVVLKMNGAAKVFCPSEKMPVVLAELDVEERR